MESTQPAAYPASFDSRPPIRFSRIGVLHRLLIFMALGVLHQSAGGLLGALYVLLPLVAAFLIGKNGSARYLTENARVVIPVLDWIAAFYAYLFFATDAFPLDARHRAAHLRVHALGRPTPGSAVLRLFTTLPQGVFLALVGILAAFVWVVSALAILGTRTYPEPLQRFQRDFVASLARVLAYHASLVEEYPPFSL